MQTAVQIHPEQTVTELTLAPGLLHIGTAEDNDLVLNEPGISAYHVKIVTYFHQSVVFDLSSEGGTFLNGERVIKHTVKNGDVLQLGDAFLKIRIRPEI